MKLAWRWQLILVVFLAGASQLCAQTPSPLAGKLEEVMRRPEYQHARFGILVADSKTGETIFAHQPEQLFIPASTTKLYSCSAALLALGSDYRIRTPVRRRGDVTDGRLQGDLILVGQGDPSLGGRTTLQGTMDFKNNDHIYANGQTTSELTQTDPLAGLKDLARQVAASGIKRIEGDVLVDDRLFDHGRSSGSGPGVVSPIMVNDNCIDIAIHSTEPGQQARALMRPQTAYFQMDADVATVAADKPVSVTVLFTGPRSFKVRGQVPIRPLPLVRIVPIEDPAAAARAMFIEALRANGVGVRASLFESPAALPSRDDVARLPVVATLVSPPLSELVKVTLKVSHNLYASALPALIAAHDGKRTIAQGLQTQGKLLAGLGVDTKSISFAGGAGGENADATTPHATVALLRGMHKRPEYQALYAGLPVLGEDGTLASAVGADSPARGKVHAKTGTLDTRDLMNSRDFLRSKALAGYLTTVQNREIVFALFVNNVALSEGVTSAREGKMLGHLCELIYLHAPPAGNHSAPHVGNAEASPRKK